jgi:signal transduction histidine kinase
MNGVMGMAQLLQMPGLTEAERIDYAGVILSSGQTLMNLLNDVLDITRLEAGKLEFESVRLQPAQIVGAVQLLFSQRARDKGLALESNWIGPELPYQGDPQRLTQMLSNLVNNAIKFTAQGGIRIEAREVACTAQHATLEFAVSDTGIGIEPQKQSLLFQNFFQIDSSNTRNYDGAGLGLSMVRQLAELMGGEVGVQSQVGQGSRFWFRIQVQGLGSTG